MRRAMAAAVLLAGCGGGGGVSNHDPARYGEVIIASGPMTGPVTDDLWRRQVGAALPALDALGPDFRQAVAGDSAAAVILVDASATGACGSLRPRARYVAATRTLTVSVCNVLGSQVPSDTVVQHVVMHALGHLLGMGHVSDTSAVMWPSGTGDAGSTQFDWSEEFTFNIDSGPATISQADVDEFRRTHP
jgi:hypothetical protein